MQNRQVPSSASSGVWARSAGDHFPYIVYGQQRDANSPIIWGVMGAGSPDFLLGTYEEAVAEARARKGMRGYDSLDWDHVEREAALIEANTKTLDQIVQGYTRAVGRIDPFAMAAADAARYIRIGMLPQEATRQVRLNARATLTGVWA